MDFMAYFGNLAFPSGPFFHHAIDYEGDYQSSDT